MNEFLTRVVNALSMSLEGIQAIIPRGSQQNAQVVDMWSDFDLLIVLNSSASIDEGEFLKAVKNIGPVVGSELYRGENYPDNDDAPILPTCVP